MLRYQEMTILKKMFLLLRHIYIYIYIYSDVKNIHVRNSL